VGNKLKQPSDGFMDMRFAFLFTLLFIAWASAAQNQPSISEAQRSPVFVPSGERMFKDFCASCHGIDAKGHGPASPLLKRPPPDLTTLAKRNKGKFPYSHVYNILLFGPGVLAHGSREMPT
jgi:mono/diheme cytochrome c family protein